MEWLESLVPGDSVAYDVNCYGRHPNYVIAQIVRITPKGQILTRDSRGNERRWKGGSSRLTDYHTSHLEPVTTEIKMLIGVRVMRTYLKGLDWDAVPNENVTAAYNSLKKS